MKTNQIYSLIIFYFDFDFTLFWLFHVSTNILSSDSDSFKIIPDEFNPALTVWERKCPIKLPHHHQQDYLCLQSFPPKHPDWRRHCHQSHQSQPNFSTAISSFLLATAGVLPGCQSSGMSEQVILWPVRPSVPLTTSEYFTIYWCPPPTHSKNLILIQFFYQNFYPFS